MEALKFLVFLCLILAVTSEKCGKWATLFGCRDKKHDGRKEMRVLPETYQELGRELQEDNVAAENGRADSELEEGKRRASNYRHQDMKTFLNQLYQ